jgi:hypothetical protein
VRRHSAAGVRVAGEGKEEAMDVIFDGALLRPVFSPRMKTVLSVIGLITNSLTEANKCMKERLAEESGSPTTLDEVMKQSGLKIPGLEEALARLMGEGEEAKAAASMLVNTPDPADLLRAFIEAPPPRTRSPIVTPPPTAPTTATPNVVYPAFRPDLAPARRAGAPVYPAFRPDLAPTCGAPAEAPAFRPDLAPTRRAEAEAPVYRPDLALGPRPAAPTPVPHPEVARGSVTTASGSSSSLVALVSRRLEALRREKAAHEKLVDERLVALERKLEDLTHEWQGLKERMQAKSAAPQADTPVAAAEPDTHADSATNPSAGDGEEQALPVASAAEVVEALTLMEEFAVESQAADERQLGRIAAYERSIESMCARIQQERVALEATPAHI